jgi:hypothetical protein
MFFPALIFRGSYFPLFTHWLHALFYNWIKRGFLTFNSIYFRNMRQQKHAHASRVSLFIFKLQVLTVHERKGTFTKSLFSWMLNGFFSLSLERKRKRGKFSCNMHPYSKRTKDHAMFNQSRWEIVLLRSQSTTYSRRKVCVFLMLCNFRIFAWKAANFQQNYYYKWKDSSSDLAWKTQGIKITLLCYELMNELRKSCKYVLV